MLTFTQLSEKKSKIKINPNMGEQNELAPKKDAPGSAKPEVDAKQKRVSIMKRAILQKLIS